jgi:putative peptidoglycan lipid II flippase
MSVTDDPLEGPSGPLSGRESAAAAGLSGTQGPSGPLSGTQGPSRRSAALVGAGIFLSRLAGLVRERVIARYLGVSLAVDAFRAALRIPNLLQNLLGEGVLSASFIPVYARLLGDEDEERAGQVAGAVAGVLAAVSGVLVVIGVVFARPLAILLTPGFTGERLDLTVTLTRVMFPGVGFLVLSAWCLGILNSHRKFFLSYVAPVIWNAAQIAAVVGAAVWGLSGDSLATALAWGVFAGGVLQFLVQLPSVRQVAGRIRPTLRTDLPEVRTVGRRFVPVVAGRGVVQLLAYVDLMLASLLAVGAVSALGYAQVFYLLPISLFGMSVAAAELPEMSRLSDHEAAALKARLNEGLARISFFVVPCMAIYIAAGDLVVGALLQTGAFEENETRLVWYVLAAFCVGLLSTTGSRLLQNAFYALGDARTPAKFAAVRVVLAAGLGYVLMYQFDRLGLVGDSVVRLGHLPAPLRPLPDAIRNNDAGALRLGAVGLALAAGATSWVEFTLLRRRLAPVAGRLRVGGGHLARTAVAGIVAAAVAAVLRSFVDDLPPIVGAVLAIGPASLAYVAAARALAVPEAADLVGMARDRVRR